jgi:hypothetical protein
MWSVEPEQIWKKQRAPGISGFMRLKNEAEFLDRAIATHLDGLDELVILHNDCTDETPEICARWQRRYPDKIKVTEYAPKVVPIGTEESLRIDPRSPHCVANYYNFALSLTNRQIAIKIDGDHIAVPRRFGRIADRVRRRLPRKRRYPIYGLNLTLDGKGEIVIYNCYDYAPQFSGDRAAKIGPPPFTSGDHAFYYVDETCWHTVEGFEVIDLGDKLRFAGAPLTYAFFHMKGLKSDRGTGNWGAKAEGAKHLRQAWVSNVLAPEARHLAPLAAMRRRNPQYFRGAALAAELRAALPGAVLRASSDVEDSRLDLRERLADAWYRLAYP